MIRALAAAAAATVLAVAAVITGAAAVLTGASTESAAADPASPTAICSASIDGAPLTLTGVQVANAATIVAVGASEGVPRYGQVVAVATAMQESRLIADLDESQSDRDSAGLFQQRRPWGPLADRMDPEKSSTMFYTGGQGGQRGLLDIPDWEAMTVTRAAQAVQVSAFPDAYAQWEPLARALVSGAAVSCTDAGGTVPAGEWTLPLPSGSYTVSSPFGPRVCSGPCSSPHKGVDLAAPTGTPVAAAAAGTVVFSGVMSTYGHMVELDHGGGTHTRYAHLSTRAVAVGDTVAGGQRIGAVGNTGRSYGAHLHFEVLAHATPINPVEVLESKGVTL